MICQMEYFFGSPGTVWALLNFYLIFSLHLMFKAISNHWYCCLIFIESIVYFEKKFALSLQMSYSENANYKIIIFSFG